MFPYQPTNQQTMDQVPAKTFCISPNLTFFKFISKDYQGFHVIFLLQHPLQAVAFTCRRKTATLRSASRFQVPRSKSVSIFPCHLR